MAVELTCSNCGQVNRPDARFCRRCGSPLESRPSGRGSLQGHVCPRCGQTGISPQARFCKKCGAVLESLPTRVSGAEDLRQELIRPSPSVPPPIHAPAARSPQLPADQHSGLPPPEWHRERIRAPRAAGSPARVIRIALLAIVLFAAIAGSAVATLGGMPAFANRFPPLGQAHSAVSQAYQRAWDWGRSLIARPRAEVAIPAQERQGAATPVGEKPVTSGTPQQRVETASPVGSIVLGTTPPNAQVELDGTVVGVTPLTLRSVPAGTHRVEVAMPGRRSVIREVTVEPGGSVVLKLVLSPVTRADKTPAPRSDSTPATRQSEHRRPLAIGAQAPTMSLKDRVGVIYKLQEWRGYRVVLLFVWRLDAGSKELIRDLDRRARGVVAGYTAFAVVLDPDRVAIRGFVTTEGIRLPVLLGTQSIGSAYGVPPGSPVLYLVSEQGTVAQRQVGTIRPGAVLP